jgi:hypothetical protein
MLDQLYQCAVSGGKKNGRLFGNSRTRQSSSRPKSGDFGYGSVKPAPMSGGSPGPGVCPAGAGVAMGLLSSG